MSDHQGIPDLGKQLAAYERRIYELERKLRLLDEPEQLGGCCVTLCAFKSGSTSLAPGATGSLSFTMKRPSRGRVLLWGTATAELASGADLFFGGRISVGGTFYDPRITERNQAAAAGDRVSVAPCLALDFIMGTDLTCTFEVQNHAGGTLTWKSAAFIGQVFATRAGSVACSPPIGGTGV